MLCRSSTHHVQYRKYRRTKLSPSFLITLYLTAIGQPPGGSSTVHIYTQTIQKTTQNIKYKNQEECRPCPVFAGFYLGICLTTEEKARKNLGQGCFNLYATTPELQTLLFFSSFTTDISHSGIRLYQWITEERRLQLLHYKSQKIPTPLYLTQIYKFISIIYLPSRYTGIKHQ